MGRKKARKHQCEQCGATAKRHVTATDPETGAQVEGWLCPGCVKRHRRTQQLSVFIYAVLQLCWVSFFTHGLTMVGIMGAFVGAWSLYHLVRLVGGIVWHLAKKGEPAPSWVDPYLSTDEAERDLLLRLRRQAS